MYFQRSNSSWLTVVNITAEGLELKAEDGRMEAGSGNRDLLRSAIGEIAYSKELEKAVILADKTRNRPSRGSISFRERRPCLEKNINMFASANTRHRALFEKARRPTPRTIGNIARNTQLRPTHLAFESKPTRKYPPVASVQLSTPMIPTNSRTISSRRKGPSVTRRLAFAPLIAKSSSEVFKISR